MLTQKKFGLMLKKTQGWCEDGMKLLQYHEYMEVTPEGVQQIHCIYKERSESFEQSSNQSKNAYTDTIKLLTMKLNEEKSKVIELQNQVTSLTQQLEQANQKINTLQKK